MSYHFEAFVEWDNSPFVLFDQKGSIAYLNHSAEILFGYVTQKELYDIALAYASSNFGYKSTNIDLVYASYTFHAITVGYEDESYISLRLYHAPQVKPLVKIEKNKLISTDINILLEAHLSLFQTQNNTKMCLLVDQDLPPFKLDQNNFSKLLRKIFQAFIAADTMDMSLKFLIGQHIIIDEKKVALIQLSIQANHRSDENDDALSKLAMSSHIKLFLQKHIIKLEIPLIQ